MNKNLVLNAIRKAIRGEQPRGEESFALDEYIAAKVHQVIKRLGIRNGIPIFIYGKELTFSWSAIGDICHELYMEFFSFSSICEAGEAGWIEKNRTNLVNLSDEELWAKFDNRAYNWLRRLLNRGSHILEINPDIHHSDTVLIEYDGRGDAHVRIERAKPVESKKLDRDERIGKGTEASVCFSAQFPTYKTEDNEFAPGLENAIKCMHSELGHGINVSRGHENRVQEARREVMDDIISKMSESQVEDYAKFFKRYLEKFGNPEILARHLRRKYMLVELVARWLWAIFPDDICFEALNQPADTFLRNVYIRYGSTWQTYIAQKAVKAEAVKKLSGKTGEVRKKTTDEIKSYYRKFIPSLTTQQIEGYFEPEFRRLSDRAKSPKFQTLLQNYINLLWEDHRESKENPK
ncbi:hypothetical protein ACFLT2_01355 [Acidobacteriota bacterium]